jgi:hypothetical protein
MKRVQVFENEEQERDDEVKLNFGGERPSVPQEYEFFMLNRATFVRSMKAY